MERKLKPSDVDFPIMSGITQMHCGAANPALTNLEVDMPEIEQEALREHLVAVEEDFWAWRQWKDTQNSAEEPYR